MAQKTEREFERTLLAKDRELQHELMSCDGNAMDSYVLPLYSSSLTLVVNRPSVFICWLPEFLKDGEIVVLERCTVLTRGHCFREYWTQCTNTVHWKEKEGRILTQVRYSQ